MRPPSMAVPYRSTERVLGALCDDRRSRTTARVLPGWGTSRETARTIPLSDTLTPIPLRPAVAYGANEACVKRAAMPWRAALLRRRRSARAGKFSARLRRAGTVAQKRDPPSVRCIDDPAKYAM
jgi:hypothetical protein